MHNLPAVHRDEGGGVSEYRGHSVRCETGFIR